MKQHHAFFDRWVEKRMRRLAQGMSRRSALAKLGKLVIGATAALPILPFDRSFRANAEERVGKPSTKPNEAECEYWKYCSIAGFLCSCCGGSATTCPPGTTPSKISWVGTCRNPHDGLDYLVNYHDCCGRTTCGRCLCATHIGDQPGYRLGTHNAINWCMSNDSTIYHCTTSTIVGVINVDT